MGRRKKNKLLSCLEEAAQQLGLAIPDDFRAFVENLKNKEVPLDGQHEDPDAERGEIWYFGSVDEPEDGDPNPVILNSEYIRDEWGGLNALAFAENGGGDYLLLLPGETAGRLDSTIYVALHETAELNYFAEDISTAYEKGPLEYSGPDDFYLRVEDDGTLTKGTAKLERIEADYSEEEEFLLRLKLDDWIDDKETNKASELLSGLEQLEESRHEISRIWALNKLSDLYLKGFGPIPMNIEKALAYNQAAIELDSHKAMSNRAACYFSGIGFERDLHKALELARRANELSKRNQFAETMAGKPGGGLYDGLVSFLEKTIREENENEASNPSN